MQDLKGDNKMNLLSLGIPLVTGLFVAVGAVIASDAKPEVGKPAPDFSLKDQDGKDHRLSEWQGQWVLLYFYPKDDTPGCTTEACTFRDGFENFEKIKAGYRVDMGFRPSNILINFCPNHQWQTLE